MAIKAWSHFKGKEAVQRRGAVLESLTRAGIATLPLDREAVAGIGVLFFDEVSQGLCTFLREVSRHGLERVLAIAVSPSLLSDSNAWLLLDAGVSDVLVWDESQDTATQVALRLERWSAVDDLLNSSVVRDNLVGRSPIWRSILRQVVEVALFTDGSVLVLGESGTGKELVARLIHTLDSRAKKRELVTLDCTTIVPELSGSEFFGHERGAFTGAVGPREGAFALANGGTLFLDEIGELPLGLQAQLLRVIQEHSYKRVGGNKWQRTHFRLVCATNRDLPQTISSGHFRSDLYYRIASCVFRLPPLRERPDDILPLAKHFLAESHTEKEPPELDEPVQQYLLKRAYPGNVRELKQLMTRMSHRHVGDGSISVGDIPEDERPHNGSMETDWHDERFDNTIRRALTLGASLKEISQYASDAAIRIAVGDAEGNLQRAAHKLGVTDRALQMRRANRRM